MGLTVMEERNEHQGVKVHTSMVRPLFAGKGIRGSMVLSKYGFPDPFIRTSSLMRCLPADHNLEGPEEWGLSRFPAYFQTKLMTRRYEEVAEGRSCEIGLRFCIHRKVALPP